MVLEYAGLRIFKITKLFEGTYIDTVALHINRTDNMLPGNFVE